MVFPSPDTVEWDASSSTKSRREVAFSAGKVSLASGQSTDWAWYGSTTHQSLAILTWMVYATELDIGVVVVQKGG